MKDVVDCKSCSHRQAGKSLFSCLGCDDLNRLEEQRVSRHFEAGQILFDQADRAVGIYCLQSGLVKLESYSADGGVQLLRLARPGEPLGYRAFLSDGTQRYRATCLTRTEVCFIPFTHLAELKNEVPEFSQTLIKKLTQDLERAEDRWLGLMQKDSEQRVAEILLEFHEVGEGWPSRKDMAQLVDIVPETFTRILARFEKRGWLNRTRKNLKLTQVGELRSLLSVI